MVDLKLNKVRIRVLEGEYLKKERERGTGEKE